MRSGCSLVILAGGRSRRMGRDKAELPAGDGMLVEHLAHRLRPVVDETIIAGGPASLELAGVRRIDDRHPGMGPLAGMHAGFLKARHTLVWVVACDLPDVEPALGPLMRSLVQDCEAVVPLPGDEPEGVCALYRRALAPRIEAMLNAGERSVRSLLARCTVRYLSAIELRAVDPGLRSFRNINTPADYEAWLSTRSS
ncbi:MAG: molybdenum cofactor guanylyltransferase [Chloroflexi bacterium]|nr:MAG: molybdenum cofactor guanylyltransferase [Chloroflexota bacterium]TMD85315.1 MAG: molybdenum cofactor guanylyltransferase [Chloroflexota bacterium]